MTEIESQKIKFYILKKRYSEIYHSLMLLQDHIDNLHRMYHITHNERNKIISRLYDCSRTLNSEYNQYVNDNINFNDDELACNGYEIKKYNDLDELNIFLEYDNVFSDVIDPLESHMETITDIINNYGFNKIKDSIIFIVGKVRYNLFSDDIKDFINEINEVGICVNINKIKKKKNKNYYFEFPKDYEEEDYLEKERLLYIKLSSSFFLRIGIVFKNDLLNVAIKTSQLFSPYLYERKSQVSELLKTCSHNINSQFVAKFLKYNYIGDLYTFTPKEYKDYITSRYYDFIDIINESELDLMKEFLDPDVDLKRKFDMIFLLLHGDEDCVDNAGILLGLLKEKKNQVLNIYNLFIDNLNFCLQYSVKKSSNAIKDEIKKLSLVSSNDIDYTKKLVSNKHIPENVKTLTMEKIEEMKTYNNDYFKQLTFVKNIVNYPWASDNDLFFNDLKNDNKKAQEHIESIEEKLKNTSYGHEKAKQLLLLNIAKWISNPSSQGTSFGLVGPPGVGKTLLAKSVSEALGIPFAQITLGGQNDGEILHGHGYTYSGSQPGMIIKKMVEMGKSRCILYFDELDKACSKHGKTNEITSVLIHLTDPNMNKSFQDRFFQGVDFPLDKVIMIFSYNDSSLVDPILLDRIEEIEISPYSTNEKIEIVQNFMLPELLNNIGLSDSNIVIKKEMIEFIIENYTQEPGVRDIKRKLEEILLNINLDRLYGRGLFKTVKKTINITERFIVDILKEPLDDISKVHSIPQIGVINGMYATNMGNGGIVPIQIFKNISTDNSFDFKFTGKQGSVMKESIKCSYTTSIQYLERNMEKYPELGSDIEQYLKDNFMSGFHIHTPSTSTPKDGPSAGCAFTCAFISRILKKEIKNDIAMTGEIELTGKITKIGGLDFKLIGSKKAGVKHVFVPLENKKDLDGIIKKYPKLINKDFVVETVDHIDEIIDKILI